MTETPTVEMPPVSWTAIGATWSRALEGDRADPLFRDDLASAFLAATGADAPYAAAQRNVVDAGDVLANPFTAMGDYVAIRTRWMDDVLTAATGAGLRQVVVLAAGLDTRAFRLDWPVGTRLFEVDLPELMEFKDGVLRANAARPSCERITIPADLRTDWPAALRQAGFDPARPVVWLLEGLLHYLSPEDNHRLLAQISSLSAAGGELITDHIEAAMMGGSNAEAADSTGLKYDALVKGGPGDPENWLRSAGWTPRLVSTAETAVALGRPVPPLIDPRIPGSVPDGALFLHGTLPAA